MASAACCVRLQASHPSLSTRYRRTALHKEQKGNNDGLRRTANGYSRSTGLNFRKSAATHQYPSFERKLGMFGLTEAASIRAEKRFKQSSRFNQSSTSNQPRRSRASRSIRCMVSESTSDKPRASKAQQLRQLLKGPGIVQGPACHDALSAHLVERAGFKLAFMSGFSVSATRLAAPDAGLISYGEMVDQARLIASATSLPVIGDGDTGYGNAMNVKRTVRGYAQAGMAGILIEDQVSPKACGHTKGRKVVSREDALLRIRAAVDARDEGDQDIVIVARTDARQAISLDEAIWRAQAFVDQGADVVFIDALASRAEMQQFCQAVPSTPKMANMLEGGGKSPILSPLELQELGFKLVAYPLSLLGVSIRAMEDALRALKTGRMPPPSMLPTFDEVKDVVGFNKYYEEEQRYASLPAPKERSNPTSSKNNPDVRSESSPTSQSTQEKERSSSSSQAQSSQPSGRSDGQTSQPSGPSDGQKKQSWTAPPPPSVDEIAQRRTEWGLDSKAESSSELESKEESDASETSKKTSDASKASVGTRPGEKKVAEAALKTAEAAASEALEEAEKLIGAVGKKAPESGETLDSARKKASEGGVNEQEVVEPKTVEVETADGWRDLSKGESSEVLPSETRNRSEGLPGLRGRLLRIRISGRDGEKKLDFNVPAGFLDGLSSTIPGVAGVDLKELLENALASRQSANPSGAIVDVESGDDRIQIFLE